MPADQIPQTADRSLNQLADQGLEPGEGLLDRIEVRAVRREETQACAGGFGPHLHGSPLVA